MKLAVLQQIHAVERQLLPGIVVSLSQAGGRISEIKRTVRFEDQIIGAIETLTFKPIRQHCALSVFFDPHHVPIAMRAKDHPPLPIQGHAIRAEKRDHRLPVVVLRSGVRRIAPGKAAGLEENGNLSVRRPFVDGVGGNVAEEQIAALANPHRSLDEPKAARQFLHFCVGGNNLIERRIESDDFVGALCVNSECWQKERGGGEPKTLYVIFHDVTPEIHDSNIAKFALRRARRRSRRDTAARRQ